MKQLKEINLIDSYMDPAELRFFTGPLNPKRYNDLIIVDDMGQIVDILPQFLSTPIMDPNRNGHVFDETHYCYGESIGLRSDIGETDPDVVFPLLLSDVLSGISPEQTRFSQLKLLISTIKKAV